LQMRNSLPEGYLLRTGSPIPQSLGRRDRTSPLGYLQDFIEIGKVPSFGSRNHYTTLESLGNLLMPETNS